MTRFRIIETPKRDYLVEQYNDNDNSISTPILEAVFDTHDNRITLIVNESNLPKDPTLRQQAVKLFADHLETYMGKRFIVCDHAVANLFTHHTVSFSPVDPTGRVAVTSPESLESKEPPQYQLKTIESPAPHFQTIINLMKNCGFTQQRIDDYLKKGTPGIQVMFDSAEVECLFDSDNNLVALCRHTSLGSSSTGQRLGYLSDTLVNPEAFMTADEKENPTDEKNITAARARGTAELYSQASANMPYSKIFLIMPPGRVEEFQRLYECKKPEAAGLNELTVLYRFGAATPKMQEKMQQHLEQTITKSVDQYVKRMKELYQCYEQKQIAEDVYGKRQISAAVQLNKIFHRLSDAHKKVMKDYIEQELRDRRADKNTDYYCLAFLKKVISGATVGGSLGFIMSSLFAPTHLLSGAITGGLIGGGITVRLSNMPEVETQIYHDARSTLNDFGPDIVDYTPDVDDVSENSENNETGLRQRSVGRG